MKITVIFLFASILQISASTMAQKVTLSKDHISLSSIFKEVRKQTGFIVLWKSEKLDASRAIDVNFKNASLIEVMEKCLDNKRLEFVIEETTIIVREKDLLDRLRERFLPDQEVITVTGKVVGEDGAPLAGAKVVLQRTKAGTTTDRNGQFQFKAVKSTDSIFVSYIGFKTRIVSVGKQTEMFIKLVPTTNGLDEIMIQAYGQTTRRTTTGNIGKLTAREISEQPVMDPLLTLQGKIAGVVVTPVNGYVGGPVKIEIRGRGSINPNFTSDPLYIVDEVPLTVLDIGGTVQLNSGGSAFSRGFDQTGLSFSNGQSPLFSLNPADIESIEVLKDGDATAIYGSRGANGVIRITTKKGKAGKTSFNARLAQGVSKTTGKWDMLNTEQYIAMRKEAFRNDGITPTVQNAFDIMVWDQNAYTDWQEYAYGGSGTWSDVQTDLSGGNEQTTFRIGAGFNSTKGISEGSGKNQKAAVSLNLNNQSLDKRFKIALTTNYSFTELNQNTMGVSSLIAPNAPGPFDSKGNLNYDAWRASGMNFPFSYLLTPYQSKGSFLTAGLNLDYNLLKGLNIKTNIGYNNSNNEQTSVNPIAAKDPLASTKPTGSASFGENKSNSWIIEPQITYNTFIGKGVFNVLVGGTVQSSRTSSLKIDGTGYTSDLLIHTINSAPIKNATDNSGEYKYAGIFARIGYNWQNRYILNLSGRRDGSSRFGDGSQFGNFGSVGMAWILTEENWVKSRLPAVISLIKFRGSYGIMGSDAVGDYQFLSQYANMDQQTYAGVSALLPQLHANRDFHWQVNKKLEGAMNISFLEDRFSLEAVIYRNKSDNQLIRFPTPAFTGFTSVTANSPANVSNSGLEFSLFARIVDSKAFSWNTTFNIGINKNVLLSYPNIEQSPYYTRYRVGESLDTRYIFNYEGVDPLTGQYVYTDHNGDGKVTANSSVFPGTVDDDRYVSINQAPKYSGGMNNQFTYRGMTLSLNFNFRRVIAPNALLLIGRGYNISQYQYDNRWQQPGDNALSARVTNTLTTSDFQLRQSNAAWTDASYIRLQTVALSYRFPQKIVSRLGVKNLSLNVNGQNLFVLTNYLGLDPEVTTFGELPPVRTLTAGLSCSF